MVLTRIHWNLLKNTNSILNTQKQPQHITSLPPRGRHTRPVPQWTTESRMETQQLHMVAATSTLVTNTEEEAKCLSRVVPGWLQGGPRVAPWWLQDGSRVAPGWSQGGPRVAPGGLQGGSRAAPPDLSATLPSHNTDLFRIPPGLTGSATCGHRTQAAHLSWRSQQESSPGFRLASWGSVETWSQFFRPCFCGDLEKDSSARAAHCFIHGAPLVAKQQVE